MMSDPVNGLTPRRSLAAGGPVDFSAQVYGSKPATPNGFSRSQASPRPPLPSNSSSANALKSPNRARPVSAAPRSSASSTSAAFVTRPASARLLGAASPLLISPAASPSPVPLVNVQTPMGQAQRAATMSSYSGSAAIRHPLHPHFNQFINESSSVQARPSTAPAYPVVHRQTPESSHLLPDFGSVTAPKPPPLSAELRSQFPRAARARDIIAGVAPKVVKRPPRTKSADQRKQVLPAFAEPAAAVPQGDWFGAAIELVPEENENEAEVDLDIVDDVEKDGDLEGDEDGLVASVLAEIRQKETQLVVRHSDSSATLTVADMLPDALQSISSPTALRRARLERDGDFVDINTHASTQRDTMKHLTDLSMDGAPDAEIPITLRMLKQFVADCKREAVRFDSRWTFLRFKYRELLTLCEPMEKDSRSVGSSQQPSATQMRPSMFGTLATVHLLDLAVKALTEASQAARQRVLQHQSITATADNIRANAERATKEIQAPWNSFNLDESDELASHAPSTSARRPMSASIDPMASYKPPSSPWQDMATTATRNSWQPRRAPSAEEMFGVPKIKKPEPRKLSAKELASMSAAQYADYMAERQLYEEPDLETPRQDLTVVMASSGYDADLLNELMTRVRCALLDNGLEFDSADQSPIVPFFVRARQLIIECNRLRQSSQDLRSQLFQLYSFTGDQYQARCALLQRTAFLAWRNHTARTKYLGRVLKYAQRHDKDRARTADMLKTCMLLWKEWTKRRLMKKQLLLQEEALRSELANERTKQTSSQVVRHEDVDTTEQFDSTSIRFLRQICMFALPSLPALVAPEVIQSPPSSTSPANAQVPEQAAVDTVATTVAPTEAESPADIAQAEALASRQRALTAFANTITPQLLGVLLKQVSVRIQHAADSGESEESSPCIARLASATAIKSVAASLASQFPMSDEDSSINASTVAASSTTTTNASSVDDFDAYGASETDALMEQLSRDAEQGLWENRSAVVKRLAQVKARSRTFEEACSRTVVSTPVEKVLIRWVNHQLSAAGSQRHVSRVTHDLCDCLVIDDLLLHLFRSEKPVERVVEPSTEDGDSASHAPVPAVEVVYKAINISDGSPLFFSPLDRTLPVEARAAVVLQTLSSITGSTPLSTASEWVQPNSERPKSKVLALASLFLSRAKLSDTDGWLTAQQKRLNALTDRLTALSAAELVPEHVAAFLSDVEAVVNETEYYLDLCRFRRRSFALFCARVRAYCQRYLHHCATQHFDEDLVDDFPRNSESGTQSSLSGGPIQLSFDRPAVQALLGDENFPTQACDDIAALHQHHEAALRRIFRHYALLNLSSLGSHAISMSDWMQICQECELLDTAMSGDSLRKIFFASLDMDTRTRRGIKSDDFCAPELCYLDFVQALIQVAGQKYLLGSLSSRFEVIIEKHILPRAARSAGGEFRTQLSAPRLKNLICVQHGPALQRLFRSYGAQERRAARGGAVRQQICTLNAREWLLMLRDARVLPVALSVVVDSAAAKNESVAISSANALSEAVARSIFERKAAECPCGNSAVAAVAVAPVTPAPVTETLSPSPPPISPTASKGSKAKANQAAALAAAKAASEAAALQAAQAAAAAAAAAQRAAIEVEITYSEFIEVLAACAVVRCSNPFESLETRFDNFLSDFVSGVTNGSMSARR